MRYMFVKMINPTTHKPVFILPKNFKAYSHNPVFRDTVVGVVVVDKLYICGFPLISSWEDIARYNGEACIIYETDFICFHTKKLNEINNEIPIDNYT